MVIVARREKEEEKEVEEVESVVAVETEEEEEATVLRKADTRGGWESSADQCQPANPPASQPTQPFRVYCSSVP